MTIRGISMEVDMQCLAEHTHRACGKAVLPTARSKPLRRQWHSGQPWDMLVFPACGCQCCHCGPLYPLVLVGLYTYVAGTSACPYFTLAFGEYSLSDCGRSLRSDRMGECLVPRGLCSNSAVWWRWCGVALAGPCGYGRDTLITLELMR